MIIFEAWLRYGIANHDISLGLKRMQNNNKNKNNKKIKQFFLSLLTKIDTKSK